MQQAGCENKPETWEESMQPMSQSGRWLCNLTSISWRHPKFSISMYIGIPSIFTTRQKLLQSLTGTTKSDMIGKQPMSIYRHCPNTNRHEDWYWSEHPGKDHGSPPEVSNVICPFKCSVSGLLLCLWFHLHLMYLSWSPGKCVFPQDRSTSFGYWWISGLCMLYVLCWTW